MPANFSPIVLTVSVAIAVAAPIYADSTEPLFWTWSDPIGEAAYRPNIIQMVQVKVLGHGNQGLSGAEVADEVCDTIVARNLATGEVSVLLHGFGTGDGEPGDAWNDAVALFLHWEDGLPQGQVENWWLTPWMSNGVAEASIWITDFITQYQIRQGDSNGAIPDPTRFHFDSEAAVAPCCGTATLEVFDALQTDPRWDAESIPGHDGKTLAELYVEAGSPPYDSSVWMGGTEGNKSFSRWYVGVCTQAVDGAMNAAAYQLIQTAWPNCLSSNYVTSCRIDGQGDPPRVYKGRWQADALWFFLHWRGSGDLQAPVLYQVHHDHNLPGETTGDASVRVGRANVEACTGSYGGGHLDISPWIDLVGQSLDIGYGWDQPYTMTKADIRKMLSMLRAEGIGEILVWNNPGDSSQTECNWNQFSDLINQVWGANLDDYMVEFGSDANHDPGLLRYSDGDFLEVGETIQGSGTQIRVQFSSTFRSPSSLRIVVESSLSTDGGLGSVLIHNWSLGADELLGVFDVDSGQMTRGAFIDGTAAEHVGDDGSVQLVIRHEHPSDPIVSYFDVVQVVEADNSDTQSGDLDCDGCVDQSDLGILLSAWGADDDGDCDGDGDTDQGDLGILLAHWGQGCS